MIVIGAGIGGLIAAIEIASAGWPVTVLERAEDVGGKLRVQSVDGQPIDAGPTVFTLPDVVEATLARAGTSLAEQIELVPAEILARHVWPDGSRLDLHAERERSEAAVRVFAGPRAERGYRRFCRAAARAHALMDQPFMRAPDPSIASLMRAGGAGGIAELARINPFASLWSALGRYFEDERLRQLFARYATYTGADPFQASASLMLIAHVEQAGVWQIRGGMHRLAEVLRRVAEGLGVQVHCDCPVQEIVADRGRVGGVVCADGRVIIADHIVCNADPRALAEGRFGPAARTAVPADVRRDPALSGVTWTGRARARGIDLSHHNVFFCSDYAAEFADIFQHGRLPGEPTVYVCAQDRSADRASAGTLDGHERFLILANAPPVDPDTGPPSAQDLARYGERVAATLTRAGLYLTPASTGWITTGPGAFAEAFPGSAGALYGAAAHGARAPFARPRARSRMPGLYLAGGSIHPGAGLPMAALSGQHAARALLEDDRR